MLLVFFERIFHFSFLIEADKSANKKQKIHLKIPAKIRRKFF